MIYSHEETIAFMAKDLFNKRQRLIRASQRTVELFDDRSAHAVEAEYQTAESEYLEAKTAFARAMRAEKQAEKQAA